MLNPTPSRKPLNTACRALRTALPPFGVLTQESPLRRYADDSRSRQRWPSAPVRIVIGSALSLPEMSYSAGKWGSGARAYRTASSLGAGRIWTGEAGLWQRATRLGASRGIFFLKRAAVRGAK